MKELQIKQEAANDSDAAALAAVAHSAVAVTIRASDLRPDQKRPALEGAKNARPADGRLFGLACLLLSLVVLVFPLATGLSSPKFFTLTFFLLLFVGCYCFDRGMPKFGRRGDTGKRPSSGK